MKIYVTEELYNYFLNLVRNLIVSSCLFSIIGSDPPRFLSSTRQMSDSSILTASTCCSTCPDEEQTQILKFAVMKFLFFNKIFSYIETYRL